MIGLISVAAIFGATFIIALILVLRFSGSMVEKTGDTKCLRDVAVLLRAFRTGPGGLLPTLAKVFKRGG